MPGRVTALMAWLLSAMRKLPMIGKGLRWGLFGAVVLFLVLAGVLLALREISAVLARVESPGLPSHGMDTLTGWHWPPGDGTDVITALKTWAKAGAERPTSWVKWHVVVDSVGFVPIYAGVLAFVFRRLVKIDRLPGSPIVWLPLALLIASDLLENRWTWNLIGPALQELAKLEAESLSDPLMAQVLQVSVLTDLKWIAAVLCLVVLAAGVRREDAKPVAALATALRVPLITVSVLAFLLVVPGGGALDQLPDILRAQSDTETLLSWMVSPPALMDLAFAIAVLLAGLVAATADAPAGGAQPSGPAWRTLLVGALLLAAAGLAFLELKDGAWGDRPLTKGWPQVLVTKGIFVLPGLLLAAWALAFLFRRLKRPTEALQQLAIGFSGDPPPGDVPNRQAVRLGGRAVAAVVIGIGGLAIVRAFVGSALTIPAEDALHNPPAHWLCVGAAATVVAPFVAWLVFAIAESALGFDRAEPPPDEARRRAVRRNVVLASGLLLLHGVVWCWLIANDPEKAEPLGAHGVVMLVLAVATLSAVLVDTSRWSLRPGAVARGLGFRTRPVFVTALAVFLLAGQFDYEVRYHAVRLDPPENYQGPSPPSSWPAMSGGESTFRTEFGRWLKVAANCLGGPAQPVSHSQRRAVPLVLVAAPGGGMRAAYWTAKAMHRLREATCDAKLIFAASGVSGGSLGLATWSADPDHVSEHVEAMAGPAPLAQTMAAMLLRDLPRGLTGVHPWWRDRGAVFEDAWSATLSHSTANEQHKNLLDNQFGTLGPPARGWAPHLVLSGTDLQRGCRVVATTLPLSLTTRMVPKPDAAGKVDPAKCSASPEEPAGAGFASGTLDVRQLVDKEPCPEPSTEPTEPRAPHLRISSAAHLSARFPFVSPTGGLVVCHQDGEDQQAVQVQVGDGGYRDNTGLTALLELWSRLEPEVDRHNRDIAMPKGKTTGPYVVPVFVVLDNHYRSQARGVVPERTPELLAPLKGSGARSHPSSEGVLEQLVAVEATDPVPALEACMTKRWFVLAPQVRPEPSAPLGWVLSDQSRNDLDDQLVDRFSDLAAELGALCEPGSPATR